MIDELVVAGAIVEEDVRHGHAIQDHSLGGADVGELQEGGEDVHQGGGLKGYTAALLVI